MNSQIALDLSGVFCPFRHRWIGPDLGIRSVVVLFIAVSTNIKP